MSKEITSKTKRLARILTLLQKAPVSVPDLAARFGVSIRTIQRDMGLLQQAQFPVLSPRQSLYELAEGFSLEAANLSAAQAALFIMASDVARQIGEDFAPLPAQIARRFLPPSFENCVFGATKYDFAATQETAIMLLKCIKYHCTLRVYLKDLKKNRTLYPYVLLRLYDKWHVACVTPGRETACYALDNIGHFSLRQDDSTTTGFAQFRPILFAEWHIWQCAHQWLQQAKQAQAQPDAQPVPVPSPAPQKEPAAPLPADAAEETTLSPEGHSPATPPKETTI